MLKGFFDFAQPLILQLEPEHAHELSLRALELGIYPRCSPPGDPALVVNLWGMQFANPVGIAAGYDKNARVPDAIVGLGFGYAEIGTTTPHAQPGNSAPRVFRLTADRAVINRLGFNNEGHAAALARLRARRSDSVVGVNIGANKDSADRVADYVAGLDTFYDVASYFTVNISSPNTPGLRALQAPAALDELLARLMSRRAEKMAEGKPKRPIVIKLAPDIAEEDFEPVIETLMRHEADGIAISNTTLSRGRLVSAQAVEEGGLSGRPLFHRSTVMLARAYEATRGQIPLIGIGGIDSGATALAKIEAGARLLQLYTGLIYEGPGLIGRITTELAHAVRARGARGIDDLTGTRAKEWAAKPLER